MSKLGKIVLIVKGIAGLSFFVWVYFIAEGNSFHKIAVLLLTAILGYWLISLIDYLGCLLIEYIDNKLNP